MARPESSRRDVPADTRRAWRTANVAAGAVAALVALSLLATQVREIRAIVPWTDDPYDDVTWFVLFLLAVVVAATWVQSGLSGYLRQVRPA